MKAVVIGYSRSPFTPAKRGELAKTRPDDIAATVVMERLGKSIDGDIL